MRANDRLELALHHARQGRRVFPFSLMPPDDGGRRAKIPKVKWKDEATTDEGRIRSWWASWPSAWPGWRLEGNIAVVDVDDPARFEAAGLEIDLRTASQQTPRGGYHLAFETDGRDVAQTVKGIDGADTRTGDHGWVGLYDRDSFSRRPRPAPEWLYAVRGAKSRPEGFDDLEDMGTRDEILAYVGRLRRARMAEPEILAALMAARADGRIVDLDESRPWEEKDLRAIAREAAKWQPGDAAQDLPVDWLKRSLERWKSRHSRRAGDRREEDLGELFRPLSEVDPSDPKPLELGFLDPDDHSILFGDGGTGKGVIAAQWVADLSHRDFVFVLDYEAHAQFEWRPRVERFGGDLGRVFIAQPGSKAIWDIAARVREEIQSRMEDSGAEKAWLVVDSIGYACVGRAVEDSATAIQYSLALASIQLPTLSLAHTTKQDTDPKHPFGSVFWSNGARVTIGVTGRKGEPRKLENKKTNQRGYFPTMVVDWEWAERDEPIPTRLDFKLEGGVDSDSPDDLRGANAAILKLLQDSHPEGMTVDELVSLTGFSERTVQRTLKAFAKYGKAQSYQEGPRTAAVWRALFKPGFKGDGEG